MLEATRKVMVREANGALSYSYVSGPCTLVSGGTFSPTGVGSCVVKASTALTTNFLAGSANQSVTIAVAGQTPTFTITPNPAAGTVTRGVVAESSSSNSNRWMVWTPT